MVRFLALVFQRRQSQTSCARAAADVCAATTKPCFSRFQLCSPKMFSIRSTSAGGIASTAGVITNSPR